MCLTTVWDERKTREWLDSQPDEIVAYKVAKEGHCGSETFLKGLFWGSRYHKRNRIETTLQGIYCYNCDSRYEPYYHLFKDLEDASAYAYNIGGAFLMYHVLKCTIPKNLITCVGTQSGAVVIVAKGFDFVEGDKFFAEQEITECV